MWVYQNTVSIYRNLEKVHQDCHLFCLSHIALKSPLQPCKKIQIFWGLKTFFLKNMTFFDCAPSGFYAFASFLRQQMGPQISVLLALLIRTVFVKKIKLNQLVEEAFSLWDGILWTRERLGAGTLCVRLFFVMASWKITRKFLNVLIPFWNIYETRHFRRLLN